MTFLSAIQLYVQSGSDPAVIAIQLKQEYDKQRQ